MPDCNVWEDDQGLYVQVALPGCDSEAIAVEAEEGMVSVKGERRKSVAEGATYHLREIALRHFLREFPFAPAVDRDRAVATHQQGLLTIAFPKWEAAKPTGPGKTQRTAIVRAETGVVARGMVASPPSRRISRE